MFVATVFIVILVKLVNNNVFYSYYFTSESILRQWLEIQLFIYICSMIIGLSQREAPQGCCSMWSTWTESITSRHHRGTKLNLRELLMSSHCRQHQS